MEAAFWDAKSACTPKILVLETACTEQKDCDPDTGLLGAIKVHLSRSYVFLHNSGACADTWELMCRRSIRDILFGLISCMYYSR